MLIPIIIILLIAVFLYGTLTGGDSTASIGTVTPSGVLDTSTGDAGNSPLDIGGVTMNVPNAVLQWQALAQKYAQQFSILDPEEILAIIWNESTGNPNANNANDPSWGLMGVTLPIGKAYAGVTSASQLLDPDTNVKAGSAFLAHLKSRFSDGSPDTWTQAYNEGETNFAAGKSYNPGYSDAFNSHLAALKGLS